MKHGKLWARILSAVCVLTLILPMISTALAATYPYDVISMDDVNMRSSANTTSTVLKKIKTGDLVSILGATGNFYRVKFDGKTGYAMKMYIDGTTPDADEPLDPGGVDHRVRCGWHIKAGCSYLPFGPGTNGTGS